MIVPAGVNIEKDSVEKIMVALEEIGYDKKASRYLAEVLKGVRVADGPVV